MTTGTRVMLRVNTLASAQHTPFAECEDCDWERHPERAGSWPATRAAAQRHAASRSHVVHAGYQVVYAYGPTGVVGS